KWLAMFSAAINVLRRFPVIRVRIEIDGCMIPSVTPFVFIGNNEYQINLLALGERSSINSGKLCLYVAKCRGRFCMFRLALLALINRLEQARDFDLRSLTEVWLETRKRVLSVSLDGE